MKHEHTHPAILADEASFSEWNEAMSAKYNPDSYHHHPNPIVRWIERRRTDKIVEYVKASPQDKILEVGVGAGNVLERISTGMLYGIDLSEALLSIAKQKIGTRAELRLGNAESLVSQYGIAAFDVVYCSEVLEHVQHPRRMLEEMRAVGKPDARFVISIPNESFINFIKSCLTLFGLLGRLFPGMAERMDDEWHLHALDHNEFLKISEDVFLIERTSAIPFFFFPIRFVYLCRACPRS